MEFINKEIKDVVVYPLKKYHDDRGWLAELFRHDEIDREFYPVMSYISFTKPGIQRGPHEHVDQADLFCFIGPSTFNMRMWDNRPDSPTYRHMMSFNAGADEPLAQPAATTAATINATAPLRLPCPDISPPAM